VIEWINEQIDPEWTSKIIKATQQVEKGYQQ